MIAEFRKELARYSRFAVLLLLVAMALASAYFFYRVLLPFALAIFLSYLLAPVVTWISCCTIRKFTVPRGAAILGVYGVMLAILILSGYYLFPRFYTEVNRMVKTLPTVLREVEQEMIVPLEASLNTWFAEFIPPPQPLEEEGEPPPVHADRIDQAVPGADGKQVQEPASPFASLVEDYTYVIRRLDDTQFEVIPKKKRARPETDARKPFQFNRQLTLAFSQFSEGVEENIIGFILVGREFVRVVVNSFFTLFLVLMLSGFILIDPGRIHGFLRSLIPPKYGDVYDDWLNGLERGLSGVVRGQAMICLVNGVLTGIGIALLGVPFVVTLSVIATVFSLIPIFGVLISTIPILLMSLTVSLTTALLALVWILVIHFIEGNFLNPKIMGDSAKIHPVLIVFALLVGEHFGGVMGALLAVPIFSLVQNSFLFLKSRAETLEAAS